MLSSLKFVLYFTVIMVCLRGISFAYFEVLISKILNEVEQFII